MYDHDIFSGGYVAEYDVSKVVYLRASQGYFGLLVVFVGGRAGRGIEIGGYTLKGVDAFGSVGAGENA